MDGAGLITCIRTIQVKKLYLEAKGVYRYKYRYEVILNGEIIKNCKARQTAKNFLIDYYSAKVEFDQAQAKFLRTKKRATN